MKRILVLAIALTFSGMAMAQDCPSCRVAVRRPVAVKHDVPVHSLVRIVMPGVGWKLGKYDDGKLEAVKGYPLGHGIVLRVLEKGPTVVELVRDKQSVKVHLQ